MIGLEKTVVQQQMDATDRQIDRLVYELYRLTEEKFNIVEEGRAPKAAEFSACPIARSTNTGSKTKRVAGRIGRIPGLCNDSHSGLR